MAGVVNPDGKHQPSLTKRSICHYETFPQRRQYGYTHILTRVDTGTLSCTSLLYTLEGEHPQVEVADFDKTYIIVYEYSDILTDLR